MTFAIIFGMLSSICCLLQENTTLSLLHLTGVLCPSAIDPLNPLQLSSPSAVEADSVAHLLISSSTCTASLSMSAILPLTKSCSVLHELNHCEDYEAAYCMMKAIKPAAEPQSEPDVYTKSARHSEAVE